MKNIFLFASFLILFQAGMAQQMWQSEFVFASEKGNLTYKADNEGNIIPDFSRVGYASGEKKIPDVPVAIVVEPIKGDNRSNIQNAIDKVSEMPLRKDGFRGSVLLKKGTYDVDGSLFIKTSGIVIRGEGNGPDGTLIRETAKEKLDLFCFTGKGRPEIQEETRVQVSEGVVPVGRKFVILEDASRFRTGDSVLLYRPGTENWIHDLKMDQIVEREGTNQWKAEGYNLSAERIITRIEGNKVWIDNPVVMQLEKRYGGGSLVKYKFPGRIQNCGIENLQMESTYQHDTDEEHGWNAINFSKVSQSWASNVISRYFGGGCVNTDGQTRNISILDSKCLDAKSQITGGRRYSFNCNGQMLLFKNCYSTEGRHDYVTGSRVMGPNVFTRCKSSNAHSDIGPHHRWASGTLYDIVETDGQINVQDRGNLGSGHGWSGANQVLWNCRSPKTSVQSPWVSGKNYCIGLIGGKYPGRFPDRPDGVWEGYNKPGLFPASLYEAQLKDRLKNNN